MTTIILNSPLQPKMSATRAVTLPMEWLVATSVMLMGAAMRLHLYLTNRSMYRDEAALALNIVNRSFAQLCKPLDNDQGAPIGFLMIEKLAVTLLGNHEFALRLVPLIVSILALPLFYMLCRSIFDWRGALFALAILAMGGKQYYYSGETKQYATDVMIAVGLMLLAMRVLSNPLNIRPTPRGILTLAICGAMAMWFSHPALFILGGIAALAIFQWSRNRPQIAVQSLAVIAAIWTISFLLNYFLILRGLSHSSFMQGFWAKAGGFAPLPTSFSAFIWYKKSFFELFEDPCSLGFVGLAAMLFILGVIRLSGRNKPAAALLLVPIGLTLIASIAHRYPFSERLILFLGPILAAFIGAGFEYLFDGDRRLVGWIALVLLMITPFNTTFDYMNHPPRHSDMRGAMEYIAAHQQPGDAYYAYEFCWYPFSYYRSSLGLEGQAVRGKMDVSSADVYRTELSRFKGKRVWVMFEDPTDHAGVSEQQMALGVLNTMGRQVLAPARQPQDDFVACYDLR